MTSDVRENLSPMHWQMCFKKHHGDIPRTRNRALKRSQLIHAPEMNNYQQGDYWLHLSICLCWCNGGNIEPFIVFTMCKNGKNIMSSITLITLRNNATVTEVALFANTKIRSFRSITLHYTIVGPTSRTCRDLYCVELAENTPLFFISFRCLVSSSFLTTMAIDVSSSPCVFHVAASIHTS